MIQRPQPYKRQIFICINNRKGESPSCGFSGGEDIAEELKNVAKEMNLKGKLRVARSGCFDLCAFGPNIMIWPEGIWFMKVTKQDLPEIVNTYMKLEEVTSTQENPAQGAAGK